MIGAWFKRRFRSDGQGEREAGDAPVLPIETDIHSHLLPGLDDGVVDLESALHLLSALERMGYRRLVTTPHVMADAYRNSTLEIREGLESLREAAASHGLGLEIDAAAEYYLDEEFQRRLASGDILTIGGEWVLFESSYYNEPFALEERIYEINARGYRPLLAHPERYRYVRDPGRFYGRLREMGVGFQVNINSLGGHYGQDARIKAEWLAERGWITFLGSDVHSIQQVRSLESVRDSGILTRVVARNDILNDTLPFSKEN